MILQKSTLIFDFPLYFSLIFPQCCVPREVFKGPKGLKGPKRRKGNKKQGHNYQSPKSPISPHLESLCKKLSQGDFGLDRVPVLIVQSAIWCQQGQVCGEFTASDITESVDL